MARIRFEKVAHRYGDREVLGGIDLDLAERRIGVVGGNGSGKSTLARMLNGLVVPSSGKVTIDDLDTRRDGGKVRRRVAFVFTDPDAQIVMPTVAEDVAFSLRRSGLSRAQVGERVRAALARVGLDGHADHPAHLLSGGQKQLLAITSVLVTEPSVLVCDEPTTLLDARNTRQVTRLLAELPQQVVMVTHHLHLLDGFDRVIVLDGGRVVADAVPAKALAHYDALLADDA
jgi:biotin transport system ATP-binding protein